MLGVAGGGGGRWYGKARLGRWVPVQQVAAAAVAGAAGSSVCRQAQ